MNLVKIVVFTFFSIIIFSACEKTIDFESAEIAPLIVVNSVFEGGSKYKLVRVEKSRSVLNDKEYFESLPNASVKLFEDGEFLTELSYVSVVDTFFERLDYDIEKEYPYDSGYYIDSVFTIKPGSTYRLEVSSEGFNPVYCETTVPFPVQLKKLEMNIEDASDEYNADYYRLGFKLTISDSKSEDNYYRLQVGQESGMELSQFRKIYYYGYNYGGSSYYENPDTATTDTIVQRYILNTVVSSQDPVFTSYSRDIIDDDVEYYSFFTDELMGSGEYNLSFWLVANGVHRELGEYIDATVSVLNISKELYFYSRSRREQANAIDNAFAEPVPVYSNIMGGMGIFGSETASYLTSSKGEHPLPGKIYIPQEEIHDILYDN